MTKRSILLLEQCSPNHFSLLETWVCILQNDPENEVNLFVTEAVAKNLSSVITSKVASLTILPNNRFSRFYKIWSFFSSCDYVIYNTIQTNFFMYVALVSLCKAKSILCVHNVNAWSGRNAGPVFKRYVKRFARMMISRQVDVYSFCSQSLSENFDSRGRAKIIIPFQLPKTGFNRTPGCRSTKLVAVYPGIVSKTRKKYDEVIAAFKYLGADFNLHLLGAPNRKEGGEDVLFECESILNIFTYESYVSVEEFQNVMSSSDVLIGDLGDCKFRRYDYDEIYGVSKDSGISHLMISYSLPAILNREYSEKIRVEGIPVSGFSNESNLVASLQDFKKRIDTGCELFDPLAVSKIYDPVSIWDRVSYVFK